MTKREPASIAAEHALRSRVLGRVIAGAVHDIRTPLGTMAMRLQLMRDGGAEGAAQGPLGQHLRLLEVQVERVKDHLRRLACVIEPPSPFGWVDLSALLADIAASLAFEASTRGVELSVVAQGSSARTSGEPEAVSRLVLSLVGTALAWTPQGGRLLARAGSREGAAVLELEYSPGDPASDVGYEFSVLCDAAQALGGRLERSQGERGLERLSLELPQAAAPPARDGRE